MLGMIQSCGVTLLDTMNHLLEFAKINKLSRLNSKTTDQSREVLAFHDLSRLVEEVSKSVAAGHAFDLNAYRPGAVTPGVHAAQRASMFEFDTELPVLVTVDIQPYKSWRIPLDSGAWKRIVMNLVGNALKYTSKGFITVKLEVKANEICFSVKDTGIGIGKEYLKHRLFTPFAQENAFSSGTGLGLCIVQQIVRDLGGRLEVQSELGVGTFISVRMPHPQSTDPKHDGHSNFAALSKRKICIFDHQETEDDKMQYTEALKASVRSIATDWLDMEVIQVDHADNIGAVADVYVINRVLDNSSEVVVPAVLSGLPVVAITDSRSPRQSSAGCARSLRTPYVFTFSFSPNLYLHSRRTTK